MPPSMSISPALTFLSACTMPSCETRACNADQVYLLSLPVKYRCILILEYHLNSTEHEGFISGLSKRGYETWSLALSHRVTFLADRSCVPFFPSRHPSTPPSQGIVRMADAPATNNAQQGGRREGSGWWGMLQVCHQPWCMCAGKLT